MRILLIEDDVGLQMALVRRIRTVHPYGLIDCVDTAPDAINKINTYAYDYILSDYDLRIGTGGDVLSHVRERYAFYVNCNRFILMSGNIEAIEHLKHKLTFEKPAPWDELKAALLGGTQL